VLSRLGRHDDAHRTLNTLVPLGDADLRASGPTFWVRDQVDFTASWVYSASGNESAAGDARTAVASVTHDYVYLTNIQLHETLCTVVNGGVDRGVRQASTILDSVPAAYRTNLVTETGRLVLRAVPLDHRARPAVAELRDVLALPPAQV
jgi:hypothetical protein